MEELTFEQAFHQLEETVHSLEAGELPLGEALALFERGTQLALSLIHISEPTRPY